MVLSVGSQLDLVVEFVAVRFFHTQYVFFTIKICLKTSGVKVIGLFVGPNFFQKCSDIDMKMQISPSNQRPCSTNTSMQEEAEFSY